MVLVVTAFPFAALVAALLSHGRIRRRGTNVGCQLSVVIWLVDVVVVVVVVVIVVVVVVVVGVFGSGAVGTAGASRNRVPVNVVIVSEAVATAGAGRLTLVILLLASGVWVAVVGIEATWVVVVNEFRKSGCKFGARPKPDVCANRHVAAAMSSCPVVRCFLPLAVWCDMPVIVKLPEVSFLEMR